MQEFIDERFDDRFTEEETCRSLVGRDDPNSLTLSWSASEFVDPKLGLAHLYVALADCNHDMMLTGENRIALYAQIHCGRSLCLDPPYYLEDNLKYCRCMILFHCFLRFHPHI